MIFPVARSLGQDPAQQGNAGAGKIVRVPATVIAFVVVAHNLDHLSGHVVLPQDPGPPRGVGPHGPEFFRGEPAGFVEDRARNAHLAAVVGDGCYREGVDLLAGQGKLPGDGQGVKGTRSMWPAVYGSDMSRSLTMELN